jgi:hypothetical protein
MIPSTRDEFKDFCLRQLGSPVITINVADIQIEDQIDKAISLFQRVHYNGTELVYIPHKVIQDDKTNKYITVPSSITGVTRLFQFQSGSGSNVLSTSFILASDALWQAMRGTGMASYQLLMNYRSTISMLTSGEKPIRFNRVVGKVSLDLDWDTIPVDSYMILEGWSAVDPTSNSLIWGDEWLQNYTVALIKLVWSNVLSKYSQVALPGGLLFSGQELKQEATEEIKELKQELIDMYSLPAMMMVG